MLRGDVDWLANVSHNRALSPSIIALKVPCDLDGWMHPSLMHEASKSYMSLLFSGLLLAVLHDLCVSL